MMVRRDGLKGIALETKHIDDHNAFKKARNEALKWQRKDKKKWAENMLIKDGNEAKNLWTTVKRISGDNKHAAIDKVTINGIMTTSQKNIASGLNE